MKKIFLLLLAYNIQANADKLSDAIRNSDIDQVKLLLQNQDFDKNFAKYLDAAEQTIRYRHDIATNKPIDSLLYFNPSDPQFKKYDHWMGLSFLSTLGSLYSKAYYNRLHSAYLNDHSDSRCCLSCCNMNPYKKRVYVSIVTALISSMGFGKCLTDTLLLAKKHAQERHESLVQQYKNATIIKELLYDHLNSN